jgi:hypothetical protein
MPLSITRPQMKKIYATAREIGWDGTMLHFFLRSQVGKEHISNLTKREAMIFIDDLVKLLGQNPTGYHADKENDRVLRSEGMILGATPAQGDKIRYLMDDAGWTEGRLKGYLEDFGAEKPEDLTRTLASNLIEYLKSEIKRSALSHAGKRDDSDDIPDPW